MKKINRSIFIFVLLAVVLIVASVAMFDFGSSAKTVFIKEEHTRNNIDITMHVFDTQKELEAAIEPYTTHNQRRYNILGFSRWWMPDGKGKCEVYVTKAQKEKDFETWGHELAHCMYGRWHKE